ncbi:MAG: alpha/beta hydrolase [Chitinophagaceae bacterium]
MKKISPFFATLLFVLQLLFCNNIQAQENWVSYSQKVATKGYEGHRFRLQALVKTETGDDSPSARLWARVDKQKGFSFFDNMWNLPIRSREWKSYSIEGKIDSGSTQIAFGALCQYNGKFYYDDVKLDIETEKGKWVNVFTANFENDKNVLDQGIKRWRSGFNDNYKAQIVSGQKAQGTKCLLIEGTNVPSYGINNKVGKYAEVNGIRLYYEIYGQGEPLLVLHEFGSSISTAGLFYPELIKKYKVIAIDNRGQGRSSDNDLELTYEQMASDINALLVQLKIDSAFVWGQSEGAIIGLILAMTHPEKVKRLLALGVLAQPDSAAIFPWALKSIEKQYKESTDPKVKRQTKLGLDYPRIPFSNLSQVKMSVLIMAGDRDYVRLEHTLKIFQNIPKSQLCIIPGTTHNAAWEKKEFFLMILNDFFHKPFEMPDTKAWYEE